MATGFVVSSWGGKSSVSGVRNVSPRVRNVTPRLRRKVRCSVEVPGSTPGTTNLMIVPAPLTSGSDVLFPGTFRKMVVSDSKMIEALHEKIYVDGKPELPVLVGHFVVEANGSLHQIGTRAAITDTGVEQDQNGENCLALVLLGMSRLRIASVGTDFTPPIYADVVPFDDEIKTPLAETEEEMFETFNDVIQLSIKLTNKTGPDAEDKRMALLGEMSNVLESLQNAPDMQPDPTNPYRRYEVNSFIVADFLDQPIYERKRLLEICDTKERMEYTIGYLEAQRAELAAKAALMDAVGSEEDAK